MSICRFIVSVARVFVTTPIELDVFVDANRSVLGSLSPDDKRFVWNGIKGLGQ